MFGAPTQSNIKDAFWEGQFFDSSNYILLWLEFDRDGHILGDDYDKAEFNGESMNVALVEGFVYEDHVSLTWTLEKKKQQQSKKKIQSIVKTQMGSQQKPKQQLVDAKTKDKKSQ